MRELNQQELHRISGGADPGSNDPPPLPEIPQTRTSGTTPDLGSLRRDEQ